jgi:hypothetical protein
MAKIVSFNSSLSEETILRNIIRRVGLPETMKRLAEEAEARSGDLNLADLPEPFVEE